AGIERQAQLFRFPHHPVERTIRQARLAVAAADIAMGTGKPDLFQRSRPAGGLLPYGRQEALAEFVEGDGMAGVLEGRAKLGVVEAVIVGIVEEIEERHVVRDAERSDRSPDADEVDPGLAARTFTAGGVVEFPVLR